MFIIGRRLRNGYLHFPHGHYGITLSGADDVV
jgi:hypothetical protein